MEDKEIIKLYFERDERAIGETAEKYGAYCHKIAFNFLCDFYEADECVNDTYMRTWNAIPPAVPRIFSAFLAKITRNLAIDRYNKAHSAKRGGGYEISLDELGECADGGSPWEDMKTSELARAINEFLGQQRELVRRIFVCRYFYQMSVKEIAKKHSIGQSQVKTLLHRARAALSEHLCKEGIEI